MADYTNRFKKSLKVVKAIEAVLVQGPLTRDLGGKASTTEVGEAISKLLAG